MIGEESELLPGRTPGSATAQNHWAAASHRRYHHMSELNTNRTRSAWNGVYRIGGLAILIAIPMYLLDIGISMAVEGADISPDALTAITLFDLYRENWILGFRALGLINVLTLVVSVPFFVALYGAHQQECRPYAALALIVWLVGATIYISNNAAIPISVLSSKYASATTDSQRTILAAAGEALIARGADFTPGSFVGFFLTEIAAIGFSLSMLRSRLFGRSIAYLGIVGFVFLSIFTICSTFFPALFTVGMVIAMVGGLLGLFWYILVALRLLRLGRQQGVM